MEKIKEKHRTGHETDEIDNAVCPAFEKNTRSFCRIKWKDRLLCNFAYAFDTRFVTRKIMKLQDSILWNMQKRYFTNGARARARACGFDELQED